MKIRFFILISAAILFSALPYQALAAWQREVVSPGLPNGAPYSNVIVFDTNNVPHFAYVSNSSLRYDGVAVNPGPQQGNQGGTLSLSLDNNNWAHIVHGSSSMWYVDNVSGSWVAEEVPPPVLPPAAELKNHAATIDSTGKMHLVCYLRITGPPIQYKIYYNKRFPAGGWQGWQYIGQGGVSSIAADSLNIPQLPLLDTVNPFHLLYTKETGGWPRETVDPQGTITNTKIKIDGMGNVHISYGTNTGLKYATNASGSWVVTSVGPVGSGPYNSLAIDSDNKVHISYLSQLGTPNVLMYATNASGAWVLESLPNGNFSNYYQGTSIAVEPGPDKRVHISVIQLDPTGAWGQLIHLFQSDCIDIGLRVYDGNATRTICAEPGAPTSPLRIAKNGTTYGIVLVDPGNANASRVRIETSSGTKALKRLLP